MAHRDVSHEEGELPPPHPVRYAEQALLGALLLRPDRLAQVERTIEPDSFDHHAHSVLFTAIRDLSPPAPAQHASAPIWLNQVLTAARRHTQGLDASYLHTLIALCPRTAHAAAYARIVQADHARRTLREHAQRLAQTATDATLPRPVTVTLAQVDALALFLDDLSTQLPTPSGPLRHGAPPLTPVVADDDPAALEEERLLLASAAARPGDAAAMRWMMPCDFTHPLHAGLWHSLTILLRRGEPIDPVTILCEAHQQGLLAREPVEPGDVLALLATPAGSAHHWGQRILQRALLTTASRIGHHIQALTDDPATGTHQLVFSSRRAIGNVQALRTRWGQATCPTPQRGARAPTTPSASPRAGPPRPAPTAPPRSRTR
ncbi:DnaB-like helicase N-terminal domain-containing protein [Streptomyces sp. NPDC057702]|uniref:DnaB-like helicase N-terminal domain-containing protein n=1 Tax=unclassified Streptomyces TaxID=2593676 RepID=UPI003680CBE6